MPSPLLRTITLSLQEGEGFVEKRSKMRVYLAKKLPPSSSAVQQIVPEESPGAVWICLREGNDTVQSNFKYINSISHFALLLHVYKGVESRTKQGVSSAGP